MKPKYLDMELQTSPHMESGESVEKIMLNVTIALVPVVLFSIFKYGLSAIGLITTTVVFCLLTEHLISRALSGTAGNAQSTLNDYSALLTGVLLGLTLPPGFPLWMAAVGGVVSIAVGKWAFGGLGQNLFNPALVGRIFLQAAFPVAITTWNPSLASTRFTTFISTNLTFPFMKPVADGFTGATPLALMKFEHKMTEPLQLFFGGTHGSLGEIAPVVILLCGLYLAFRRMLDWRIPASIFLTIILVSGIFYMVDSSRYPSPLFMLFSGGLMLGAVFMATDMVSSPVTPLGICLYGGLIGFLVVIIRLFGGLPEGVAYSIILGNSIVPILNRLTQPRVYGTQKRPVDDKRE